MPEPFKKDIMKSLRKVRQKRVRQKVTGSEQRPRLSIFRSNRNIYAQIINDQASCTLVSASSRGKDFSTDTVKPNTKEAAFAVGELLSRKAKDKGITTVCLDRGGYKYHGRVKALSDGARKGGLKF